MSRTTAPEILWLDPARIRAKISPVDDLHGTKGGDWDRERVFPLADAIKHRAIAQRYREGRPWEETDLFREAYARRLAEGDPVRGAPTMAALLEQYYDRVDGMFADMKAQGFRLGDGRIPYPLPTLLLGRSEIFIGNQGNHRLAMAQVLGLERFAGRITCRHALAAEDAPARTPR